MLATQTSTLIAAETGIKIIAAVHSQCRCWVVCHEHRRSKRRCATVREMKEGPSRPEVRFWSQATASCCREKRWWCCVKKTRERHAVREMKEDPSEPSCRGRLQTAMSCFGQNPRW